MTPKRPIELVDASKACARAWLRRDKMIDAGDTVGVDAMNTACDLLQERYNVIYSEWQAIGGTSNIDSIALFDPRTPEQIALDEWQAEVSATRESDRPF